MKRSTFICFCFCILLFPHVAISQLTDVTFKASLKTTKNEAIPRVYIKIYEPGNTKAVDSLFSDTEGNISHIIPFTYQSGLSVQDARDLQSLIVKKLYPNIISQSTKNYTLEYNYPGIAQIYFIDIQGKTFPNHSELSSGMYFYYIKFEDGVQSEYHKIMVTDKNAVNVDLINVQQSEKYMFKDTYKKNSSNEVFYAEFIKDGYVTKRDTISIDSAIVEKKYTLTDADKPIAMFNVSGIQQVGEIVLFNATASTSANGEELIYSWDFGDNKKGQSVGIPHLFDTPGDYVVTLTVSGNFGASHSTSKTITIDAGATTEDYDGVVNGYITSESLLEIPNVNISLVEGETTGITNNSGKVSISGLPVGIPIHLKITKPGYVHQTIELIIPSDTKEALFYTTLKTRESVVRVQNIEFGGVVEGDKGTTVTLPVDGLLKEDGTVATGEVDVSITPVDVAYETESFPGTFIGYNEEAEDGVLLSYGVSEFHFQQGDEELQLAEGKTATVLIPIYTSGATEGDQIPLWSINEDNGSWMQEGIGTVVLSDNSPTGLALKAEVGHFSWWNCDDFQDERKRNGLCWRWECSSAICYKVKVGCWMSGAQRDSGSSSGLKSSNKQKHKLDEREDIPPVFEVRDFVPAGSKQLRFPNNRDVFIEARTLDPEGNLFLGRTTVQASDMSDTFKIELELLLPSDTLELKLNDILKDYLDLLEILTYKVQIPKDGKYTIYLKKGDSPSLIGNYSIKNNTDFLTSGEINIEPIIIEAKAGWLNITISGLTESDDGNYILGIYEEDWELQGDTLNMELNSQVEDSIDIGECKHYRVNITEPKIYGIKFEEGSGKYLNGMFAAKQNQDTLISDNINLPNQYFYATTGELYINVYGIDPTYDGSYKLSIFEIETIPIDLNDSIIDSLTINKHLKLYSLDSDGNTVLKTRYYIHNNSLKSADMRVIVPGEKNLIYESFNSNEKYNNITIRANTTYLFEVSGNSEFEFVIVNEEEVPQTINYGDTITTTLEDRKDVDMFSFTGNEGDIVSIKGALPEWGLNGCELKFIDNEGNKVTVRAVDQYESTDDEIIYRIPANGTYSIAVYTTQSSSGTYQVILNQITLTAINYNQLNVLDVLADSVYYYEIEIPENTNTCVSVMSDASSGKWDLWSATCEKFNENSYRSYTNYIMYPYIKRVPGGKYYLKISNNDVGQVYFNIFKPLKIEGDSKGFTALNDSIDHPYRVNAYEFNGAPGDGIHAILNRIGNNPAPEKLTIRNYAFSDSGEEIYLNRKQISYYQYDTPDTTILSEIAGTLSKEYSDTTWFLVVHAESIGKYEFNLHHVPHSSNIVVDDDFSQYANAHTSSAIAAGYAIEENGSLYIANGEYYSYLPLRIEKNGVEVTGQDKDSIMLANIFNQNNNPALYINATGLSIRNISISSCENSYPTTDIYGEFITLENINLKPFGSKTKVCGPVKVRANNTIVRNITITNANQGIDVGGTSNLVENCYSHTVNTGITCSGSNITVKNNTLIVDETLRALKINAVRGNGNNIIDSNQVMVNFNYSTSDNGIVYVMENGTSADSNITFVRNNTVNSAGDNWAFMLYCGNPPSQLIVENNTYKSTYTEGSKALYIAAGRTDGASSIIVRNNTFDGLKPKEAIYFNSFDVIGNGHQFGLYNNSFRIATTAASTADDHFIYGYPLHSTFTDTASVYIINNIFEGNGISYFMKCFSDFSLYSDYNVVYNFSKYIDDLGTLIGTTNDQTGNPLFLDNNLHIGIGSSAINNGTSPTLFPLIPTTDKDGTVRPLNGLYDIGAFETE